jgi:hypothetical protein
MLFTPSSKCPFLLLIFEIPPILKHVPRFQQTLEIAVGSTLFEYLTDSIILINQVIFDKLEDEFLT